MKLNSFKELIVWQRAMELVNEVYRMRLPADETYALQSQLRRSAISVPSNIAEGHRRKTRADFLQFLHIADGSCAELETQLLLVNSLYPHISIQSSMTLLDEVQKMLGSMMRKLRLNP